MRRSNRHPFGRPAVLDRLLLRRAAVRYAAHGWTVTPGACLTGRRFSCGRPGCPIMRCHPATESWEDDAAADPARVALWWRHRPHAVLLTTGWAFDAIEVPATLGRRAMSGGAVPGPVVVTPDGQWVFLVRPGRPLCSELDARPEVIRHGRGSWIPAAPSRTPAGPVRWAVSPEQVRWRPADPGTVQTLLLRALDAVPRRAAVVPRQLSTARRAV
jgi:hypothetical protein